MVAVTTFIPGYSFTRVFESLFERLSVSFSIHWIGLGYKGPVVKQNDYTIHPNNVNGGDIYGAYGAAALAKELNAKTVLLLTDFFLLKNYVTAFGSLKQQHTRLIAYVPVDGTFTDVNIVQDCFFLDELVLFHKGAMQEVNNAIDQFLQQHPSQSFSVPHLSYRYHGVDCSVFQLPTSAQQPEALRKKLFDVPDAAKSIFILNANRYDKRKNIEATISAFAKALPQFNRPAYLCLHTPNLVRFMKPALISLIENSGCKKNILLNPLGEKYVNDEELVQLYQACSIGVNSSFGEGWGMISFEHAACGAAQLVPTHTASGEVWKDAGILIPFTGNVQLTTNPFQMYAVDEDELSRQLVKLVNDDAYLEMSATKCYTHSCRDEFKWESIALQWTELL